MGEVPGDIPADVIYIFEAAVAHVKKSNVSIVYLPPMPHAKNFSVKIRSDQVLKLYGLYKQATIGDCNEPAPSRLQVVANTKWKAWNANKVFIIYLLSSFLYLG